MVKGITGGKNPIEFYVDDDDAFLLRLKWHARYSKRDNRLNDICLTVRFKDGKQHVVSLHRIIMKQATGNGVIIDHIDGNPANNCKDNLRFCTTSQNAMNMKKNINNSSGYKGVSWHKKSEKYRAYIGSGINRKYLGYYSTAEEAHEAYKQAAIKYFGEFARFE